MKFKQKLFVGISLFLILAVSGGFYVNSKLNNILSSLNQPGSAYMNPGSTSAAGEDSNGSGQAGPSVSGNSSVINGSSGNGSGAVSQPSKTDIAQGALSKVNRPVEKSDLVKAGFIVLHRLNSDEISYLYAEGMKDNHSQADLVKVRNILQAKLTPEELEEMEFLGYKYGKNLEFLSQ